MRKREKLKKKFPKRHSFNKYLFKNPILRKFLNLHQFNLHKHTKILQILWNQKNDSFSIFSFKPILNFQSFFLTVRSFFTIYIFFLAENRAAIVERSILNVKFYSHFCGFIFNLCIFTPIQNKRSPWKIGCCIKIHHKSDRRFGKQRDSHKTW